MGGSLQSVVGIMGNVASLLLYVAPVLTFRRIFRKKSTEEFTCIPYILTWFNCLLYTWYGLPVVSHKWENFPVVTTNAIGILLEGTFVLMYVWFASPSGKKKVGLIILPITTIFFITVFVSTFALHDHGQRKVLVGTVALVASIAMYGSPLVVMKQVIKTKSVEFMPFYLSLFSLLCSVLWMLYGLLGHDLFLAGPSIVGCPLGIFQLVLYCIYRKRGIIQEPKVVDLEKNEELKVQEPVIISCVTEKH